MNQSEKADWLFSSLTLDPSGHEIEKLKELVSKTWPKVVLVDAPQGCCLEGLHKRLVKLEYGVRTEKQECSRLGDATTGTMISC